MLQASNVDDKMARRPGRSEMRHGDIVMASPTAIKSSGDTPGERIDHERRHGEDGVASRLRALARIGGTLRMRPKHWQGRA